MKINLLLVGCTFCVFPLKGQFWESKDDTLFYKAGVIIGDSTGSENSQLTLISNYNREGGGGYGLISKHSTDHYLLNFKSRSRVGYTSLWYSQAQCAAFAGGLTLKRDNSSGFDSHSAGGIFYLEFNDYAPYNFSSNTHYLGGIYSTIKGNISTYPEHSIIAAVIGKDQILNDATYAGYFLGRGYFSGNVGIGSVNPSTKLQISEGDVYISDIDKGIIMKSPDGQCWRGTMDNTGKLVFTQIDCPDEELTKVNMQNSQSIQKLNIFPNPTGGFVTIKVDNMNSKRLTYSLYTSNGALIEKGNFNTSIYSIDISKLAQGNYLLTIHDKKGNFIASEQVIRK